MLEKLEVQNLYNKHKDSSPRSLSCTFLQSSLNFLHSFLWAWFWDFIVALDSNSRNVRLVLIGWYYGFAHILWYFSNLEHSAHHIYDCAKDSFLRSIESRSAVWNILRKCTFGTKALFEFWAQELFGIVTSQNNSRFPVWFQTWSASSL